MQKTRAYLLGILVLIYGVAVYQSDSADKYGHENEVLLLVVRIQRCICEPNDTGSLKHRAIRIHGRLVSGIRLKLRQSWRFRTFRLQNEE
jgi:hypothetical protein